MINRSIKVSGKSKYKPFNSWLVKFKYLEEKGLLQLDEKCASIF